MLAVYIKHSFTHTLESRFCFMNFPCTLEVFAVAFTTAICCSNTTWQLTCACYTSTWTKTKKTSNPYSLERGVCETFLIYATQNIFTYIERKNFPDVFITCFKNYFAVRRKAERIYQDTAITFSLKENKENQRELFNSWLWKGLEEQLIKLKSRDRQMN